jgi:hypothetical protein
MLSVQRNGIFRAVAHLALGVCVVQALIIVPLHHHGPFLPDPNASAAAGLRVTPKWDDSHCSAICPICTSLAHFLPGAVFEADTGIASAHSSVPGPSDPISRPVPGAAFPRGPPFTSLAG